MHDEAVRHPVAAQRYFEVPSLEPFLDLKNVSFSLVQCFGTIHQL